MELGHVVPGDVLDDAAASGRDPSLTGHHLHADQVVANGPLRGPERTREIRGDEASDRRLGAEGRIEREPLAGLGEPLVEIAEGAARLDGDRHVSGDVVDHAVEAVQRENDVDGSRGSADVEVAAEAHGDDREAVPPGEAENRLDVGDVAGPYDPARCPIVDAIRAGAVVDWLGADRPGELGDLRLAGAPRIDRGRHSAACRRGARVSTQTLASGKILCGFARFSGSKTERMRVIISRSSGENRSGIC